MSLNILQPIPDFIAAIEGGFRHSDLPAVLQKIYLEYWLRNWIVAFAYNSLPAFHSPMQALRQAASGVHFKTPTNLSGESMSDTFDEAPMLGIGQERVDYIPPSSLEGPYKDYKDRYWYMDFYDGPQPPSDELSPVAAGADRYDAYPNRSFFELPPDVERICGYNVFPRLRPPNMDTKNPYTEGGNHDTYVTDLNYDGIVPGMNQNQVHVFIEWILVRLLRGSSLVTPLYLSYIRHNAPYLPYSRANNYADIFEDAEVEGGLGLIAREGASNTYSLTRAKVYVDILKVLDALKMFRIVQDDGGYRTDLFELDPDSMTAKYYNTYLEDRATTFPDWARGTFGTYTEIMVPTKGPARRTMDPKSRVMLAYLEGEYSGLLWTPSGPPYHLDGGFSETTSDFRRELRMIVNRATQSPWTCYYYGGDGVVSTIIPLACRYLDDCDVKEVYQHFYFHFNTPGNTTPAVAARDWVFSTDWGMQIVVPAEAVMPRGAWFDWRDNQWHYPVFNGGVVRQAVDNSAFFDHLVREYDHLEVSCTFTDHRPPTDHDLYVSNVADLDMIIETVPRFDLVADVSGVFERFRNENTLPASYDWQAFPMSLSPYVEWYS